MKAREVDVDLCVGPYSACGERNWTLAIDLYGLAKVPERPLAFLSMPAEEGDGFEDWQIDLAYMAVILTPGQKLIVCQSGLLRSASLAAGIIRRRRLRADHIALAACGLLNEEAAPTRSAMAWARRLG